MSCPLDRRQQHLDQLSEISAPMRRELCARCCVNVLMNLAAAVLVDNLGQAARGERRNVNRALRVMIEHRLQQYPDGVRLQ